MTMKSPLTRSPLSRLARSAVQLLTRQSVTPLSRAALVRQLELLCEAFAQHCSSSGWRIRLKRVLLSRKLSTYLTQKAIQIPNNAT